jgi:hypothetical protein
MDIPRLRAAAERGWNLHKEKTRLTFMEKIKAREAYFNAFADCMKELLLIEIDRGKESAIQKEKIHLVNASQENPKLPK